LFSTAPTTGTLACVGLSLVRRSSARRVCPGRDDEQHRVGVTGQDHRVGHRQHRRAVDQHDVELRPELGDDGLHPLAADQRRRQALARPRAAISSS
jgi:hypothetical protein